MYRYCMHGKLLYNKYFKKKTDMSVSLERVIKGSRVSVKDKFDAVRRSPYSITDMSDFSNCIIRIIS